MKKRELPFHHEAVWTSLQLLDDNQRMTGSQLMEHSGIKDKRELFKVIRDLRRWGYPIGSSKQEGKKGYYEARTPEQIQETIKGFEVVINDLKETVRVMKESLNKNAGPKTAKE